MPKVFEGPTGRWGDLDNNKDHNQAVHVKANL
jgi:hypothetical protein